MGVYMTLRYKCHTVDLPLIDPPSPILIQRLVIDSVQDLLSHHGDRTSRQGDDSGTKVRHDQCWTWVDEGE